MLLRRLENDPQLHNVTHIIVDECCVLRQYFGVKGASETSMASCKLTCACKIRRAFFLMIFRVATTVAVAQSRHTVTSPIQFNHLSTFALAPNLHGKGHERDLDTVINSVT